MKQKLIVCAGMPRSGTTFLYYNLKKHPEINAASLKEINYFSFNHHKGDHWFKDLFQKDVKNAMPWMDVSPVYFFEDASFKRMQNSDYEVKLVIGLREPSSWIPSIYNQVSKHTLKKYDWEQFQRGFQWNVEGHLYPLDFSPGFLKNRLEEIRSLWKGELFLYDYEFLNAEPLKLLQHIEEFCGISSHFNEATFENKIVNAGGRESNKLLTIIANNPLTKKFLTAILPKKTLDRLRDVALSKTAQDSKAESKEELVVDVDFSEDQSYLKELLELGSKCFN